MVEITEWLALTSCLLCKIKGRFCLASSFALSSAVLRDVTYGISWLLTTYLAQCAGFGGACFRTFISLVGLICFTRPLNHEVNCLIKNHFCFNNNNKNKLQLGGHPVAMVILHVYKI